MKDQPLSHRLLHTATPFLYNRDGVYYFRRRVPEDVQQFFKSKVICQSLRTTSRSVAVRGASVLAHQYESQWMTLRLGLPSVTMAKHDARSTISINEALELYLRLKAKGRPLTFETAARRNVEYLQEAIGDRDLTLYTSVDAGKFRDYLIDKGLASSSIRRVFSTVKAIFNLAAAEHGIEARNPFAHVYFPDVDDVTKRQPLTQEQLNRIKASCYDIDDDMRWVVALIADTGMRLAEAAGLYWEDVFLDADVPYIEIRPNAHRRLKTVSSTRSLPLVGSSLWALQQASEGRSGKFVFKRYMKKDVCNANSASAAINKWLKAELKASVSVHSFRHTMRDRLRAVQCPTEIIDACGGWATDSVGSKYGTGYPLDVLHEWMNKM